MITGIVCLMLALATVGNACMCMPSHPQEHICRTDSFVALVKVRSEAYVSVHGSKPQELKKMDGFTSMVFKHRESNEVEENLEANIVPTASANEAIVKERFKNGRTKADYIRYRIKIYKAYKGIDTSVYGKQKFYIYTTPDEGICGRKLNVKGTYMIIGNIINGRLTIGLCNHVIQWKSLPKAERRNIRENMMAVKSVCEARCKVTSCLWSDCSARSHTECTWSSEMERQYGRKYNRANFLCVPGAKSQCEWSGVAIARMEKRARRRRRRHSKMTLRRRLVARAPKRIDTNPMP